VSSKDDRGPIRSELVVHSANLELLRDTFGKYCSWDFDSEILLILLSFFSRAIHYCSSIWNHTVTDTADLSSDIINPLVSTRYHHFVVNDLLRSQNYAIFTNDS